MQKYSSSIDWYLIQILARIVAYALIIVAVLKSDLIADILYRALGVAGNSIKIFDYSNPLVSEFYYFRCATRFLRPLAYLLYVKEHVDDDSVSRIKLVYYFLAALKDFLLALVGVVTFLGWKKTKEIVSALQRELAIIHSCVGFYVALRYYGDGIAAAGCLSEAISKNGLLFVMLAGDVLPSKISGFLGAAADTQKLLYLIADDH